MLQSMVTSPSSDVLKSLETIREKVKARLMNVPEYRAFLAIQKAIAEISEVEDLVVQLDLGKQMVVERLMAVREYRALLVVEKSITDISEVLAVLTADKSSDVSARELAAISEISDAPLASAPRDAADSNPEHEPGHTVAETAPCIDAWIAISTAVAANTETPEGRLSHAPAVTATKQTEGSSSLPPNEPFVATDAAPQDGQLAVLVREGLFANLKNREPESHAGSEPEPAESAKVA